MSFRSGGSEPLLGAEPGMARHTEAGPRPPSNVTEVFRAATQQPRLTESLDYEHIQNQVSMEHENALASNAKRRFYGYTGRTLGKFIVTIVTGLVTGVVAVAVSESTELMHGWKNKSLLAPYVEQSVFKAWGLHLAYTLSLAFAAGAVVQLWCPSAAGAGVAPVMAYLNGNFVPHLLDFKTFAAKFFGTLCTCSANLAMGPEGPMVHMGACIASIMSTFNCSFLGPFSCCLSCYRRSRARRSILGDDERRCALCRSFDDTDHREFVSAGTACGLAAAFGAPIGGVLFSMEEACSYWSRKVAWRCFLAAMLSAFVISQLNSSDDAGMLVFDAKSIVMSNKDWLYQAPLLAGCAAFTGVLGALFNILRNWVSGIRVSKRNSRLRLLEVVGVAFLTISVMFAITHATGSCVRPPPSSSDPGAGDGFSRYLKPYREWLGIASLGAVDRPLYEEIKAYGVRWSCPEGHYNDLATLFFNSPDATIKRLFSLHRSFPKEFEPQWTDAFKPDFWHCGLNQGDHCHYTTASLATFSMAYLFLMGFSTGIAAPGGMFMPSIMVGSSAGALFGIVLEQLLPVKWGIYPGVYALVGATSVLGGVFRASISLVVIMVEGTRGIEFLFGVIVAIVVSNWTTEHIHHHGVYERELEQDGNVHFLRLEPPRKLQTMLAKQVMASPVIGLRPVESVSVICQVLRCCTHNGFPVFASNEEGRTDRRVTGLVLRSQLLVLLRRGHLQDANGQLIRRVENIEAENISINNEMRHFYNHGNPRNFDPAKMDLVAGEIASATSDVDIRDLYVNLRPFMNQAVITVREETSAARCHEIFTSLMLRHLCVVDAGNRLVGIITRKDLDFHAGSGKWRMTAPPPMPSPNILESDLALAQLTRQGSRPVLNRAYPSYSQRSFFPESITPLSTSISDEQHIHSTGAFGTPNQGDEQRPTRHHSVWPM